jgi:hypothetical protein
MIATASMDVMLKNEHNSFEMQMYEANETEHEIEVYSCFFNPLLKRGWVGDLTYYCYRGYTIHAGEVEDVELMTIKDVLLRSVQCDKAPMNEAAMWKYTFLKD